MSRGQSGYEDWGNNRDEFPVRDMRYCCPVCYRIQSFSYKRPCDDCREKADKKEAKS